MINVDVADIELSRHAVERIMERFDLEKADDCDCLAKRAWKNGRTPDCFEGRMCKFLTNVQEKSNMDIVVKVHQKKCFIFSGSGKLITAYWINSYEKYMNNLKPYEKNDDFWCYNNIDKVA